MSETVGACGGAEKTRCPVEDEVIDYASRI
jgi:hypothetical protein